MTVRNGNTSLNGLKTAVNLCVKFAIIYPDLLESVIAGVQSAVFEINIFQFHDVFVFGVAGRSVGAVGAGAALDQLAFEGEPVETRRRANAVPRQQVRLLRRFVLFLPDHVRLGTVGWKGRALGRRPPCLPRRQVG